MNAKMARALGLVLVGLALAALLAAVAGLGWLGRMSQDPGVTYGPPPYVPLATEKSLGVNADLSRLDAGAREQTLTAMEDAGFRWLRQRFAWNAIESEQGALGWKRWDELIESATRHNLRIVALLDGSPAWARAGEDVTNPFAPPVRTRDFGDFAAAFAERYGDRIDHYQIWDEPNIAPHWGAREIDPTGYGRLLREGAIRVRAADPGAVILMAALAPNVEQGGANMSELLFLDELYQHGADEWFDVVAAQPYDFGESPTAPPDRQGLNWKRVALLREVMEAHGDAQAAVWAVSFGLSRQSAESVEDVVVQSREDWPWLGPMLWAAWSPGDLHGEYALLDANAQLGAGYRALQSLAKTDVLAWPGVYPADHPSARYEGDWRAAPSGADIGGSGDRLTIPFWGTRLDVTVRRGDYRAFLFVRVDGQPANGLPRDAEGRAYVVLYDPLLQVDTVTLARDLPDGDHVAEIVAERGWGQWAIVGWAVSREVPGRLPWLALVSALAAVAILAVTAHLSWSQRSLLLDAVTVLVKRFRALDDGLVLALTATMAILVYISVGTVVSVATLGLLALLLLLRPQMGLPLIAFGLPFYQLGKPLLGKVFSMVEILTLLAAVGWLVNLIPLARLRQSIIRHLAARFTVLDWGMVALVGVGAASLLWAEHGRVAAREFRTVVLEAALFYLLLRSMVRRQRQVWRVVDAWMLGAAAIAVVGISQWALGQNLITAEGVWRVRGFYGSPNNLALYLGRAFPLAIAIAAWGQGGRRRWLYALAAGVMAAALLLTYSRGAWLVGVPVSLLFLAVMRGRRTLAVVGGALAVVAVVVLLVVGTGRLTSLLNTSEGTTFFRLQLWQSSWAMIRDHPFLGVGLDNFLYHYRTGYVLPTAWEEFNLSHPHNLVFDFWLRLGLPGLIVLVWLLVAFFRRGWHTYRDLPRGNGQMLILGLMAGMVNFVAHGLVDNAFFLVDLAFVFVLMLALVQVPSDV